MRCKRYIYYQIQDGGGSHNEFHGKDKNLLAEIDINVQKTGLSDLKISRKLLFIIKNGHRHLESQNKCCIISDIFGPILM
jgi:hypothetical protein